jgi:xanthine dehydrogenase iron-sulfur cluster and FAD-binding subunit A
MTVLDYLRTVEKLSGTKEGCAEGDCGACTVVLGEPAGDGVKYRAVNACIMFAPALDGKQIVTVEHLSDAGGAPHPVQQAMVEHHASQCGFCTPGFVMSLFALHHAATPADRTEVNDALAGNLCRCTGYRPIADAALAVCEGWAADAFTAGAAVDAFAAGAAGTARRIRRSIRVTGWNCGMRVRPGSHPVRSPNCPRCYYCIRMPFCSPAVPTSGFGSPNSIVFSRRSLRSTR